VGRGSTSHRTFAAKSQCLTAVLLVKIGEARATVLLLVPTTEMRETPESLDPLAAISLTGIPVSLAAAAIETSLLALVVVSEAATSAMTLEKVFHVAAGQPV